MFATLPEAFYQRVEPTPLPDPYLIAFNEELAEEMGFVAGIAGDRATLETLSGNKVLEGSRPLAAAYAGHQFGVWVPQLGDGRAILLGEIESPDRRRWEVQLKGSGLTRFSRMGDGRAVLRSTIREYLASEAMHGLGIPTTRALAIVGSDLEVYRERTETAAVLTRVAPSFVRFGSFEFFASRNDEMNVRLLADYVIERYFPALLTLPVSERYLAWYREITHATARLMADWIAVGWTHGVMNTDNMSILGLTLYFGPYGWMDEYDLNYIPNHTDSQGRYSYGQQPGVGLWNCARLGEALLSLMSEMEATAVLEEYRGVFTTAMDARMRAKFGLLTSEDGDQELMHDFLALLFEQKLDYTRSFRALSQGRSESRREVFTQSLGGAEGEAWEARYQARLHRETSNESERSRRMKKVNPKYVLRNYMAQEAINLAETRNYERIEVLRKILAAPFDEHPEHEEFAAEPPAWSKELVLSCSS